MSLNFLDNVVINGTLISGSSASNTLNLANVNILGTGINAISANYTYINNLSSQNYVNTLILAASSLQIASISATSTAVGSITAKMPIYDATGSLVGYIPIYTS